TLGGNSSGTTTTNNINFGVTISGGIATVVLTPSGKTSAVIQTVVNGIKYQNTNLDNPTPGARVFTLTQIKDSGGSGSGNVDTTTLAIASTVTVAGRNDAPTLTATALNPAFAKAAAAVSVY